jgi:hypothetical protein
MGAHAPLLGTRIAMFLIKPTSMFSTVSRTEASAAARDVALDVYGCNTTVLF